MSGGYVYFVQARASGLIKIGRAADLRARLSALRSQSPDHLSLLGFIETDAPAALEAELHAKFASTRERGEWFRPNPRVLAYVRDHATPPLDAHWGEVVLVNLYGQQRMLEHFAASGEG